MNFHDINNLILVTALRDIKKFEKKFKERKKSFLIKKNRDSIEEVNNNNNCRNVQRAYQQSKRETKENKLVSHQLTSSLYGETVFLHLFAK